MLKKTTLIVIMVFLLFFLPLASQAQEKSLFISGFAFYPMDSETIWESNSGVIWIEPTSPKGKLRAPVFLPEGAIIKKVILRYKTQGDDITFSMTLYRRNMYTDVEQVMASMIAPLAVNYVNLATYSIAYRTVNNSGYCYYVVIDIPPSARAARIAGVKILYE